MTCQGEIQVEMTRVLKALHELGESLSREFRILQWMVAAELAPVCAIATRLLLM